MHHIKTRRDAMGRLVIVSVTPIRLDDPLEGLTHSQRFNICRQPLTRDERQLLRATKALPPDQQHVVLHQVLVERRARFEDHHAARIREAVQRRQQDVVDDENARTRRHGDYLRRSANRQWKVPDRDLEHGQ